MKPPNVDIRCSVCGRFIAYEDFLNGEVGQHFTPSTEFTDENIELWHESCEKPHSLAPTT